MTENHTNNASHVCTSCGSSSCGGGCWKRKFVPGISLLLVAGALVLTALFFTYVKEYQYIGRDINSQTSITVSGDGSVHHAPDIAELSFSITHEAKTVTEAQTQVNTKMVAIHKFLNDNGIENKDIKTTGYNFYPKYEWQQAVASLRPCFDGYCPPTNPGKQILLGYEATQSVDIKVRKIDDAGKILSGLGANGATNVNGPTFSIDNPDQFKSQARQEAIAKAKAKAEQLSRDLGVKLVRIVSFNEDVNYPMYFRAGMEKVSSMGEDAANMPPNANITPGENKITSNVTIVYEIR